MNTKECPECARLREQSSALYADYVAAKDELAMTRKNDPSYSAKVKEFDRIQGLLKESRMQSTLHGYTHRQAAESPEISN